ncbi:MAG: hypothetical protein AAF602_06290 [Myxococcota bacterium]
MADPIPMALTGRAARWLHLLQDLGHIDIATADELIMAASDLHRELRHEGNRVDLDTVRQAAAMLLFTSDSEPSTMLNDDWPLLFS